MANGKPRSAAKNGRPLVDSFGDTRPAMEVALEYGLAPFHRIFDQHLSSLGRQPACVCGHAARLHHDHANHQACECPSYDPVEV